MKTYLVTLPITALARLEVEANSEEAAIEKSLNTVKRDHIEDWDAVESIIEGNVCYALRPWRAEAEEIA